MNKIRRLPAVIISALLCVCLLAACTIADTDTSDEKASYFEESANPTQSGESSSPADTTSDQTTPEQPLLNVKVVIGDGEFTKLYPYAQAVTAGDAARQAVAEWSNSEVLLSDFELLTKYDLSIDGMAAEIGRELAYDCTLSIGVKDASAEYSVVFEVFCDGSKVPSFSQTLTVSGGIQAAIRNLFSAYDVADTDGNVIGEDYCGGYTLEVYDVKDTEDCFIDVLFSENDLEYGDFTADGTLTLRTFRFDMDIDFELYTPDGSRVAETEYFYTTISKNVPLAELLASVYDENKPVLLSYGISFEEFKGCSVTEYFHGDYAADDFVANTLPFATLELVLPASSLIRITIIEADGTESFTGYYLPGTEYEESDDKLSLLQYFVSEAYPFTDFGAKDVGFEVYVNDVLCLTSRGGLGHFADGEYLPFDFSAEKGDAVTVKLKGQAN